MSAPNVVAKRTLPEAVFPSRNSEDEAGFDLTLIMRRDVGEDKVGSVTYFDTGIALEIPKTFFVIIAERSSLHKTGYSLVNSVGIIDSSYRGNLIVALRKVEDKPDLQLPFRAAQMIIIPRVHLDGSVPPLLLSHEQINTNTSRGTGGFGSTGFQPVFNQNNKPVDLDFQPVGGVNNSFSTRNGNGNYMW